MSESNDWTKDWKVRLRYGKLHTPYSHFTLLGAGELTNELTWNDCRPGPAILSMKIWASCQDEAFDVFRSVAHQIEFEIDDKIELYDTDPKNPPKVEPYAYDLMFTPFER